MRKIAVFASGHGTNFEAIHDAILEGKLDASIALLVVDRKDAPVIQKGKDRGIDVLVVTVKPFGTKEKYEEYILEQCRNRGVQSIVLAGYMRLITPVLLDAYPNNIINIHPALLPLFPGKDAITQQYRAGATTMGVTVHYVDAGMDTGPILAQDSFERDPSWTLEECEERIHAIEHVLYYTTLKKLWEE